METALIVLLLFYNIFLVAYIIMGKYKITIQRSDEKKNNGTSSENENTDSIIGKSKFQMQAKVPNTTISAQNTATASEDEDIPEMPVTFAEETQKNPSARVAEENLDATFEDVRISEVPVEYEGEDLDLMSKNEYASGKSFEQIAGAIKTADNPKASSQDRKQAGEVFSEMEGNDLFEKIIKSSSEKARKISSLIEEYEKSAFSNNTEKEAIENIQTEKKLFTGIEDFNIRDFV